MNEIFHMKRLVKSRWFEGFCGSAADLVLEGWESSLVLAEIGGIKGEYHSGCREEEERGRVRSSRGQLACLAAQSESDAPRRTPRSESCKRLLACRHAPMRQEALLMRVCPPRARRSTRPPRARRSRKPDPHVLCPPPRFQTRLTCC